MTTQPTTPRSRRPRRRRPPPRPSRRRRSPSTTAPTARSDDGPTDRPADDGARRRGPQGPGEGRRRAVVAAAHADSVAQPDAGRARRRARRRSRRPARSPRSDLRDFVTQMVAARPTRRSRACPTTRPQPSRRSTSITSVDTEATVDDLPRRTTSCGSTRRALIQPAPGSLASSCRALSASLDARRLAPVVGHRRLIGEWPGGDGMPARLSRALARRPGSRRRRWRSRSARRARRAAVLDVQQSSDWRRVGIEQRAAGRRRRLDDGRDLSDRRTPPRCRRRSAGSWGESSECPSRPLGDPREVQTVIDAVRASQEATPDEHGSTSPASTTGQGRWS